MGRFSPTVLPTGVNPWAATIAGLGRGLEEGDQRRVAGEERVENDRLRKLQMVATRLNMARLGGVPDGSSDDDLDDEGLGGVMMPPVPVTSPAPTDRMAAFAPPPRAMG